MEREGAGFEFRGREAPASYCRFPLGASGDSAGRGSRNGPRRIRVIRKIQGEIA